MMSLPRRPIARRQKQKSHNLLNAAPTVLAPAESATVVQAQPSLWRPLSREVARSRRALDFSQCLVHNPLASLPGAFCVWAQAMSRLANEPELPFNSHSLSIAGLFVRGASAVGYVVG